MYRLVPTLALISAIAVTAASAGETPQLDDLPAPSVVTENQFSGAPKQGRIKTLAEGEAPEEYVIELGDTLFDVCDQLVGEPGYWPKLWSLNTYIKNPHFVWPGMRLHFYPGDDEAPPTLRVVFEPEFIPVERGKISLDDLLADSFLADLTSNKYKETRFVNMEDIPTLDSYIESVGEIRDENFTYVTVPGFIYKKEVEPLGTILGGVLGEDLGGEGRSLLVDAEEGILEGMTYSVLRFIDEVSNAETGDDIGYKYQFVGNINVTRRLDDGAYAMALVTQNRLTMFKGDLVVPFISTIRKVSATLYTDPLVVENMRIMSFGLENQELGAVGYFAFLDRGEREGVAPGQTVKVHQDLFYLVKRGIIDEGPKDAIQIGSMTIIDTTETGSVGYITQSDHEMYIGDMVGHK